MEDTGRIIYGRSSQDLPPEGDEEGDGLGEEEKRDDGDGPRVVEARRGAGAFCFKAFSYCACRRGFSLVCGRTDSIQKALGMNLLWFVKATTPCSWPRLER
ncbi:MAG: hypothetical protein ACK55Z_32440, partial [bacterium]